MQVGDVVRIRLPRQVKGVSNRRATIVTYDPTGHDGLHYEVELNGKGTSFDREWWFREHELEEWHAHQEDR